MSGSVNSESASGVASRDRSEIVQCARNCAGEGALNEVFDASARTDIALRGELSLDPESISRQHVDTFQHDRVRCMTNQAPHALSWRRTLIVSRAAVIYGRARR